MAQDIHAVSTLDVVIAGPSDQHVIAAATSDVVVTGAAEDKLRNRQISPAVGTSITASIRTTEVMIVAVA